MYLSLFYTLATNLTLGIVKMVFISLNHIIISAIVLMVNIKLSISHRIEDNFYPIGK